MTLAEVFDDKDEQEDNIFCIILKVKKKYKKIRFICPSIEEKLIWIDKF